MIKPNSLLGSCCAAVLFVVLAMAGCSRQQSDWQKTREANTADAYEQFLKKYPSGEFTAQAQARVKEMYEERDWQKARDADTAEAYQAFLKQYPEGKWTEEARIRVENFTLAQAPSGSAAAAAAENTAPMPAAEKPPVKAAPQVKVASAAKSPSGSYRVQLGAFKSGSKAAHQHWAALQKDYPTVLAGLSSKVLAKKTAEGTVYRLQSAGLTETHARAVCRALKAKSQVCVVVPPP